MLGADEFEKQGHIDGGSVPSFEENDGNKRAKMEAQQSLKRKEFG